MACCTVVIFSADSSGISHSNSSSRAITSSTVSRESAPKSSTKEDSLLTSSSLTPSCSTTIFLTRSSTLLMTGTSSQINKLIKNGRILWKSSKRYHNKIAIPLERKRLLHYMITQPSAYFITKP